MCLANKFKRVIYTISFFIGKLLHPLRKFNNRFFSCLLDFLYTGCLSSSIHISKGAVVRFPSGKIEGNGIWLGRNSNIGRNAVITTWKTDLYRHPQILIGDETNIGQNSHITAINKIIIGNNVLTGKYITITDNSHGQSIQADMNTNPNCRELFSKGPVIIEDYVWIGDKVTICPNVRIGKGSIIGANSVITKEIPQYSVAVGNPARIIKILNDGNN